MLIWIDHNTTCGDLGRTKFVRHYIPGCGRETNRTVANSPAHIPAQTTHPQMAVRTILRRIRPTKWQSACVGGCPLTGSYPNTHMSEVKMVTICSADCVDIKMSHQWRRRATMGGCGGGRRRSSILSTQCVLWWMGTGPLKGPPGGGRGGSGRIEVRSEYWWASLYRL